MYHNLCFYFKDTGLELGVLQRCEGGKKLYVVKMVFQLMLFGCIRTCCLLVLKKIVEGQDLKMVHKRML